VAIVRLLGLALSHFKTYYYRLTVKPTNDFDKNITFRIVWDRREILKIYNDKVKSLKYAKELVPTIKHPYRFYETKAIVDIDWKSLPEQFVCKVSHGSGGVVIVHKNAPEENTLPSKKREFGWHRLEIPPKNFDSEKACNIFENLIKSTYGQGLNRRKPEWGYWSPEPRLIIEEFLSLNGKLPPRIECNVIEGEVKTIIANYLSYPKLHSYSIDRAVYYDPSKSIESFAQELQVSRESVQELIRDSVTITTDCEYLRIDWLLADEGFIFNEITTYSGGGNLKKENEPAYRFLSNMWLPKLSDYR